MGVSLSPFEEFLRRSLMMFLRMSKPTFQGGVTGGTRASRNSQASMYSKLKYSATSYQLPAAVSRSAAAMYQLFEVPCGLLAV